MPARDVSVGLSRATASQDLQTLGVFCTKDMSFNFAQGWDS